MKAETFVLFAWHDEKITPGLCTSSTRKLVDYLIEQGM